MTATMIQLVGIGQPVAGDDGVGIHIVRQIATLAWSRRLRIHELTDPLRLIDIIGTESPVILVDAVVANGQCGTVTQLSPEQLELGPMQLVSTHGTTVAQALQLAASLHPGQSMPDLSIVAVTIMPPSGYSTQLSAEVAAAVPGAVELIHKMVEDDHA